jgi:ABC-2 type transport system permease protein
MNYRRIQNILKKEWIVMFSELNSALFVTLLPLLIVGQAVLFIWLGVEFGSQAMSDNPIFQSALQKLINTLPALGGLPIEEQIQVLLLSQFSLFLLLIPTMIAIGFATFSIVEEKLSRTLEALLATPVRTGELLLGKALSGAIPAVVISWLCAGIFLIIVHGMGWGHLVHLITNTAWFITLFLLIPAVAVLSFLLGIIGSSRARDAKSAQNIVIIVVLPVLGLIGLQITGLVWFTPLLSLVLVLAVCVVDVIIFRLAKTLFKRESIVVSWR